MSRRLSKSLALLLGVVVVAASVGAASSPSSSGGHSSSGQKKSSRLVLGVYDDSEVYGHPSRGFALLRALHVPMIRLTFHWGGVPLTIAPKRPENAADPADPAYVWGPYDETMKRAADAGTKVMATIVGTPSWANGGKRAFFPPKNMADLRKFAKAVATRYSGDYTLPGADEPLPAIKYYLAWNEPNNPVFLRPQFKKVGKRFIAQSAVAYTGICNAVYAGVHSAGVRGVKVGCGVTAPRGNNRARGKRPSISPLVFLKALKKRGARFDAYAHHPYYGGPTETPSTKPGDRTSVTMGNIGDLLALLKRLYGPSKHLWITEYGYQTKPPDPSFGVSWAKQAKYLRQAYAIARRNPRIDILMWFLLRDERSISNGWQSGLISAAGKRKPVFKIFGRLER